MNILTFERLVLPKLSTVWKLISENKLNKTTASQEKQKIKVRRLSVLNVCEFVVENNIHTDIELFTKLTNFLVSRSNKSLQDLLSNAWKMESSTAVLARKATTRMEVVRKCSRGLRRGLQWGMAGMCRTSLNPK